MPTCRRLYARAGSTVAIFALSVLLAACDSGGNVAGGLLSELVDDDDGGGPAAAPPPPVPPTPPPPGTDFGGAEFDLNYGLGSINADGAYEAGATGKGITVAVIDTGIDVDHPDLVANISPDSIDIVTGDAETLNDANGHGTHVSGITAAVKNDIGVHGVAFNATILAIRVDVFDIGLCPSPACVIEQLDIANALDYAVANGADVINLSLGQLDFPSGEGALEYMAALQAAVDSGAIVVAASGNDALTAPGFPALAAGLTGTERQPHTFEPLDAKGLILAVGAVDKNDDASDFHNNASRTEDFFLVAPGVDVLSTWPNDELHTLSGTSMASPHVAGAAALLLELFPSLTPKQVVELLLATATDLGDRGPDQVFGMGLVNLGKAVNPLGTLSIPLSASVSGPGAALSLTSLSLGPAFGDALGGASFLGGAVALDDLERPYRVDLSGRVASTERGFSLDSFITPNRFHGLEVPSPGGASAVLGYSEARFESDGAAPLLENLDAGPAVETLSLTGKLSERSSLRLGYNVWPQSELSLTPGSATERPLFWASEDLMGPQLGLVGRGAGGALTRRIGKRTALSLGWFTGAAHDEGEGGAGRGSITQLHLAQRLPWGASLGLGVALVREQGSFLNSRAGGAFRSEAGSRSRFYTLSAALPIGRRLRLEGSISSATTTLSEAGAGLIGDWSTVRANAFGLGLVATGLMAEGDRLGLLVGQPLRVNKAEATLTLPTARDLAGNVIRDSRRLDLTPSGREIDLQLAYERTLDSGLAVSSFLMMQLQPGHQANAAPAFGAGLKLRKRF